MNCMQSLEKQVGQIFKMLEKTEDRQIKGEYQLSDTSIKPRPVIVKFARYSICEKVFKSKKNSRVKMLALQKVLPRYHMSE